MKKICKKCGRELPLECFNKYKKTTDGLQSYCKECKKQYMVKYNAEHCEKKKQYMVKYNAEHCEEKKQYMVKWHAEHADEQKQYRAERYSTLEGYACNIRQGNLRNDRKQGRIGKDEDPLPPLEYYIWALQQPDFYDGKQYHWSKMGLDRIYNDKPHTFANVVPCSTKNNILRGKKSFEEWKVEVMEGLKPS